MFLLLWLWWCYLILGLENMFLEQLGIRCVDAKKPLEVDVFIELFGLRHFACRTEVLLAQSLFHHGCIVNVFKAFRNTPA